MELDDHILEKYKKLMGGEYVWRDKQAANDVPGEEKVVKKNIIVNDEVELTEFSYDIKIVEISNIKSTEVLAYELNMFSLNDPDIIYRYRIPVSDCEDVSDSLSFYSHTFNLVEHPFKD